jgi:N-methylhydantoinase B
VTDLGEITIDPITLAVVWNALISASEEMGAMLKRTAFSPGLREAQDYATTIYTRDGQLVAHGACTPGHVGAGIMGVPKVLRSFHEPDLNPGDAIIYNDLSLSNGHLPDFFCLSPIFVDEELLAYAVSSAHMIDIGGLAPGSLAIEGAVDVYAEGMRVTPIKFFRAGEPVAEVVQLISDNVRLPEKVIGDLNAMVNANRLGATRIGEIAKTYGATTVSLLFEAIADRSEQVTSEAIQAVPNGVYRFEDQLDDYGADTEPLHISAVVTVTDDRVTVDFDGSSPQVAAGINSYLGFTWSYTLFALKALIDPETPLNSGTARRFNVSAPEGSFLNPRHPAPGGGRAIVLTRVIDVVIGALSQAIPDRAVAAASCFVNACLGGHDPRTGDPFVYFELLFGGSGAGAAGDGVEAICSGLDVNNIPIEISESGCPIVVERLAIVPDSGGAGRYRGGCGIRKDIRILADEITFTNMSDRVATGAYGLLGGGTGTRGVTVLRRGFEEVPLESKGVVALQRGDVLSWRIGGAGGYGLPAERAREQVLSDVVEGYVTLEGARRDYGVEFSDADLSAASRSAGDQPLSRHSS